MSKDASSGAHWNVKQRGSQVLDAKYLEQCAQLGNGPCISVRAGRVTEGPTSYIRHESHIAVPDHLTGIDFTINLDVVDAKGASVGLDVLSPDGTTRLVSERIALRQRGRTAVRLEVRPGTLRPGVEYLARLEFTLAVKTNAVIRIGNLNVELTRINKFRPLRFRFDSFGDEAKASSRLRVFKIADALSRAGHEVTVGSAETAVDVYVAQKVRPFSVVKQIREQNPAAVCVYDFDDNYVLPEKGVLNELIAYCNYMDVVTCGSEFLAEAIRPFHRDVYVLDNPVDIASDLFREPSGTLESIGWFGSPEGLMELPKAGIAFDVTTVSRGGDIEFDLATIDAVLTTFDLLIFPVEPTQWNLAKNANRMMKAVALGVPVLVSATPEQLRIVEEIGLPEESVVPIGGDWAAAVERLRADFPRFEAAVRASRDKLLERYSDDAVTERWFECVAEHISRRMSGGRSRLNARDGEALKRVSVITVETGEETLLAPTLVESFLDWSEFGSVRAISPETARNLAARYSCISFEDSDGDFFSIYGKADRFLKEVASEWILFLRGGVYAAPPLRNAIVEAVEAEEVDLIAFATALDHSPEAEITLTYDPFMALLVQPKSIGCLLCRTHWLRAQSASWAADGSLWSWAVLARAFGLGARVGFEERPFTVAARGGNPDLSTRDYASWVQSTTPQLSAELPDWRKQWARVLQDVTTDVAGADHERLPRIIGALHARMFSLQIKADELRQQVKILRKQQ